jgi:lipoate-protein ligase A
MKLFETMGLWLDPVARAGPEAMAVDEWLLEITTQPVLRVYRWDGAWASLGYFGEIADAEKAFPGVELVRRWTGGGMVDHRQDWTYTVVSPKGERLASERGAESYRRIHSLLAEVLVAEGIIAHLSSGEAETGATLCFENPVNHDLVGLNGCKLAGAGQRRTRRGLLHQGSVAAACQGVFESETRAQKLAEIISNHWEPLELHPPAACLKHLTESRYGDLRWRNRR